MQKQVCLLDLKQVIVAGELKSIEDMAILCSVHISVHVHISANILNLSILLRNKRRDLIKRANKCHIMISMI